MMNLRNVYTRQAAPKGTALILAMSVVLLLSGLSVMLMSELSSRSLRSQVNTEDVKSFEAAEAGLDAAIRDINTGGSGCMGLGWTDVDGNGKLTASEQTASDGRWKTNMDGVGYTATGYTRPPGAALANKFKEKTGPTSFVLRDYPRPEPTEFDFYAHTVVFADVRYYTYAIHWGDDGIDNDGDGLTDDSKEQDWYTIWSTGFSNPASPDGKFTTVEAIVEQLTIENVLNLDAALELQIDQFKQAP